MHCKQVPKAPAAGLAGRGGGGVQGTEVGGIQVDPWGWSLGSRWMVPPHVRREEGAWGESGVLFWSLDLLSAALPPSSQ